MHVLQISAKFCWKIPLGKWFFKFWSYDYFCETKIRFWPPFWNRTEFLFLFCFVLFLLEYGYNKCMYYVRDFCNKGTIKQIRTVIFTLSEENFLQIADKKNVTMSNCLSLFWLEAILLPLPCVYFRLWLSQMRMLATETLSTLKINQCFSRKTLQLSL